MLSGKHIWILDRMGELLLFSFHRKPLLKFVLLTFFFNNLYQEGSVLDSDVFDMWGDKGTYSKAFSIHFGYYKLMGC